MKLPRKEGTLTAAIAQRKGKWRHPLDGSIDVEKILTSTNLEDMKLVNAAPKDGKQEPIHVR